LGERLDAREAEDAAARFLERQGYKIAQRNFSTHLGEIDIVALDQGMIVFVEVKSRRRCDFGPPEVGVDRRKQARLRRLAQLFLQRYDLTDLPCRFDVVALTPAAEGRGWDIELFQDAF